MTRSSLSECGNLVRIHIKPLYLSALFAKEPEAREALFTLYALQYELNAIADKVTEQMVGLIRLQWWRDAIDSIYDGGSIPPHPVIIALADLLKRKPLPRETFDVLLTAYEAELEPLPFADMEALETYIHQKYGSLFTLAAWCLQEEGNLPPNVSLAASAWGMVDLLLWLPKWYKRNRCFVPKNLLEEAGIPGDNPYQEDITQQHVLIEPLTGYAQGKLTAFDTVMSHDPQLRPLFLLVSLARAYHDRIAKKGASILWQGEAIISPLRMQWVMMKEVWLGRG